VSAPVDHEARRRVRDTHDASLFVEAGAGTGKTTALVDRVVALVAAGVLELRHLAAITFTEAAASELRDRIRGELEAAAAGRTDWVVDAAERIRCHQALEQLDDAALTTLHGFAQRILTEHPLEAGLPPGFEVLDDVEARIAFDQHWSAFVDHLFADPELEHTLLTGLFLGLRLDNLRAVARELHENHDRLAHAPVAPAALCPVEVGALVCALDDLFALRDSECTEADDKLASHIAGLVPYREQLVSARDHLDKLQVLNEGPTLTCKVGRKAGWRCAVEDIRARCTAAEQLRAGVLDEQRRAVLETLAQRVTSFITEYAQERRREGRLEFHDLLVLARDVLRDDPKVRAATARRYRRVLLDEFQDTDPLQIQLAVLIGTDDPTAGSRPWQDVTVGAGAVSVVGDPKQSIYRFRRADLGVYHDAQRRLGFTREDLVENFRSVPDVVDFVNHLFDRLFADAELGVQAPNVHLHAARPAHDGPVSAGIFGEAVDQSVGEIREREAAKVAALVQRVKGEGWPIVEKDGSTRPAKFEDVALLIPSRTVLPGLEAALEVAGIPARVESQSLVFSTAEVRDLLAILTAIDDPTDDLAVVAALRSPAFGCSDRDLADWSLAGGRWDHRRSPPGELEGHRVEAALAALRELWAGRWWRSVSEIVEAVVRERRLLELAVDRRRPRDHWRRIRFFLDQARAWDDGGGHGLRGFVEWVRQQADERARVIESVAPEPDDDAVRILTVHGAKGLEFPVVVLAGLNTAPLQRDPPVLWGDDGPEISVGTKRSGSRVTTAGYAACLDAERRYEDAERLRLLYVAMTRARDYLLVSLHHKVRSNCHAARIAEHLAGAPYEVLQLAEGDGLAAAADRGRRPPREGADARETWLASRAALLRTAGRPAALAATTLAKEATGVSDDPALAADGTADGSDVPPWRRGRAGTAIGRAVHAVLQTVDLDTGGGLDETARAQALAEGVPDREREVRELAASVLGSPVVRAAVEGKWRRWREVPVAADVDGTVVEGFIDLLVETPDGYVIVDYKTDRAPSDDELDAALRRYSVQGAAYALALQCALGTTVTRCIFVFARVGGAVEREVVDLHAAIRAVEEQVALAAS